MPEDPGELAPDSEQRSEAEADKDSPAESSPESVFMRSGDPDEFDEELTGDVVDPDDPGKISVPPGLLRRLLADPVHAPALLATRAVEQFAERAQRDVRLLRDRNPNATDRQLAVYFKRKYSRAARWEGAGTGTAGLLGLPADLVLLAWIQNRLVLSIAATYGHDMSDHAERATELLMIQGVHNSREVARRAVIGATQDAARRLILRHLRKQVLVLVKQMFRVVGIKFTRKALLEKGVPLISVPISAGVNDVSTRLLANQAIKFYDTTIDQARCDPCRDGQCISTNSAVRAAPLIRYRASRKAIARRSRPRHCSLSSIAKARTGLPSLSPFCLEAIAALRRLGASAQCRSSRKAIARRGTLDRVASARPSTPEAAARGQVAEL